MSAKQNPSKMDAADIALFTGKIVAPIAISLLALVRFGRWVEDAREPANILEQAHRAAIAQTNPARTNPARTNPRISELQPFVRARFEQAKASRTAASTWKTFRLRSLTTGLDVAVDLPIKVDTELRRMGIPEGVEAFPTHIAYALTNMVERGDRLLGRILGGMGSSKLKLLTTPLDDAARASLRAKFVERGIQIAEIPRNFALIEVENLIEIQSDGTSRLSVDESSDATVARDIALVDEFYACDYEEKNPSSFSAPPLLRLMSGKLKLPSAFSKVSGSTSTVREGNSKDKDKIKGVPKKGVEKAFGLVGLLSLREKVWVVEKINSTWDEISKVSKGDLSDPAALALSLTYKTLMAACPAIALVAKAAKVAMTQAEIWLKTAYNYGCAGNKWDRSRSDKIKDYKNVNRSRAMDVVCAPSWLGNEAEWIATGYRPYFYADRGIKNWFSWWQYNPGWDHGDAEDIKELLRRRSKYGKDGP
jgi:hypothetical protein